MYIVRFLHQTTTWRRTAFLNAQLYIVRFLHQTTTYNRIFYNFDGLYIVRFLHQTTTDLRHKDRRKGCISSVSYIKPQQSVKCNAHRCSCISSVSYIKPQLQIFSLKSLCVVYRPFPTSNHNRLRRAVSGRWLYIVRFLHQTTTCFSSLDDAGRLYIVRFLHQTTTNSSSVPTETGCISSVSYIKPQRQRRLFNRPESCISSVSYIKPQLRLNCSMNATCCISSVSYIKPQLFSG